MIRAAIGVFYLVGLGTGYFIGDQRSADKHSRRVRQEEETFLFCRGELKAQVERTDRCVTAMRESVEVMEDMQLRLRACQNEMVHP